MKTNINRGFTLIESLAVLIILAIGMAVSIPLFSSAMSDGRTKQCRTNMQAIANAEEQYKYKSATHSYTTILTNLVGDFPIVPLCPDGGTYTVVVSNGAATAQSGQAVRSGGLVISCSKGTHGKFAPTVDVQ